MTRPYPLDRLIETRRPLAWLTLLCVLLWLPGFFALPPGDRDESRFAQASRQMVESGDPVRIRFRDEDRNKKPVGIHWAQAGVVTALEVVGVHEARARIWAYRIPSALGAWLAVLATAHFGRALVGRRAAVLGAALLAACFVLTVEARIAKTDAALLATVAASMGLMGRAYLSPETFAPRHAAAFWLVLGAGLLLKGPIGPMVALLAGVTLAASDRFSVPWLRALRPAWGVPLTAAVALPWLVAIGLATDGRFFAGAVGGDLLSKVGGGEESHWGPPGYYLATFGLAAFPAAFLVLRALPGAWEDRLRPAPRFLLAWAAPTWLVFEAVSTKLPHYTMPTFPALMLLAAAWALDPLRRAPPRWLGWLGWAALGAAALGLAAACVALPLLADGRLDPWSLLAVPAALVLLWRVAVHARAGAWARAGLAAVLLAVPVQWVAFQAVLPRLHAPWVSAHLDGAIPAAVPPERIGLVGHHEPSAVFALGAGAALLGDGAEGARFLAAGPGRVVAVEDRHRAGFEAEARARGLALPPAPFATVEGFNYSRGRRVTLRLWRTDPP